MTDFETISGSTPYQAIVRLRATLAERDAEIARLRADPNRLDLASVPIGYRFESLSVGGATGQFIVILPPIAPPDSHCAAIGTGPTPAAALADAVGRIG